MWDKLDRGGRKDEMTLLESVSPGRKRKSVVRKRSQGQVAGRILADHNLAEAQTKSR